MIKILGVSSSLQIGFEVEWHNSWYNNKSKAFRGYDEVIKSNKANSWCQVIQIDMTINTIDTTLITWWIDFLITIILRLKVDTNRYTKIYSSI